MMRLARLAIVCVLLGMTGCLKHCGLGWRYHGTASTGDRAHLRFIELPKEWTDVKYYSWPNYQEFVATGSEESWRAWCKDNYMPSSHPDEIDVLGLPNPRFVKVSFMYDEKSAGSLVFMRSKVKGDGACRTSWFDPAARRIIYQEAFL